MAVVVPPVLICTIGGPGGGDLLDRASLPAGGGPPGGVQAPPSARSSTTPGDYGDCGPDALPETGLQGQVPRADQDSGRSRRGYRCNLRLVGQNDIQLRGANFQLGWYENCAYVGSVGIRDYQGPPTELQQLYRQPQLTYADDHPGNKIPALRFTFEVTAPKSSTSGY